ncbi:MAG: tol-pal system protein YbgF [Candidatus Krumholzibacteriia bacterium]
MVLASCNGKRPTLMELRTARLEDQVAALERTRARLAAAVDSLSTLVEEQVRVVRNRRAEQQERLSELERQMHALQAALDGANEEIRELKDRLSFALSQSPAGAATGTADTPRATVTPRALYDAAYQDLTRGNHGLALMGFQEVLAQFPLSELADNAQYWIGETYYDQQDYERALEEFRKVPGQFGAGDKVPAAMLKIGFCLLNLEDPDAARRAFQELIDRYPDSEEARLAKTKLRGL